MTDHPCKGMTAAQIEAFERIAINQPPGVPAKTIGALLRAGVVTVTMTRRRDAFGGYEVPEYSVPLPIHMQWCEWCAEQPEIPEP